MLFGHDITCGANAAVELVNTAPEIAGTEQLTDPAELHRLLLDLDFKNTGPPTPADLAAVRRLRTRLSAVLTADSFETAAELVNELIANAGTTPRLTNHDGFDWHIDFHTPGAPLVHHVGAEITMAIATLLVSSGRDRIRRCAAPDCERMLVDLSRNGSRRYCHGRNCGNRIAVQAYRARRARE
ncbi:CGNR zinc finger domain-containing protein [Amycolatopsis nigrescens]|uniref:CGNR zinc finger domain-containing protein n=1 Tax=Amycolatopsis nigrescens TaxID=381445 RepID=UPI000373F0E6|nr:CGNR zinc finger domain-containing protein [Amycolatopsis nigrescens]